MKFTKEEALEKLKGILTNDGKKPLRMSERSIKSQLEILTPMIADDEMELDSFIGKVKASFETMNSNMEKDNSDFVTKWESEHKKEEKKETPKEEKKTSGDEKYDSLLELVTSMKKEIDDAKKEKSIKSKKNELMEAMDKKGIKDKEWIETFLSEVSVTEDMDIDAKADSYLKIYNKSKASEVDNHAYPKSSSSGNKNNEALFSDFKADAEKLKEQEKM